MKMEYADNRNETGPHVGIDIEEEEHEITDVGTDFDDGHSSDIEYNVKEEEKEEEEEMEEEAPEGTATLKQRGKMICENDGEGFKKSFGDKARTSRELDNVLTREELVSSYVLRNFRIKLAKDVTFHDELEREWSGKVLRWKDGRTWITG
ncbi:hypothetical protein Patl1_35980 [Pistacia atlantica]|nr:hypothetical protein Patl1_35980 [Pistacia atlantica]